MYNQTVLNPIAFAFTLIMCLAILAFKREYIIIPLILVSCFITSMQRVSIAGIDFSMIRIIILFGFLRLLIRRDQLSMTFNSIDKTMIYYAIAKIGIYTIQWANINAFIYMLGSSLDSIGAYFLIRFAIFDLKNYDTIMKTLIISSFFVAVFMVFEHLSGGRNLFYVFGGVPEFSDIRNGRLRAQGAFGHSIMAGTFGAMLLPLAWALWYRKYRIIAVLGAVSSIVVTLASSSSGPILSLIFGLLGIFFWFFNKYTRAIRNMFFISLILLHLAMKAPVWHLIARIDIVGGSTGYHRYLLIDAAIHNFSEWFILGIRNTAVWGAGLQDITNQYLFEAVQGGLVALFIFIVIIKKCFTSVGMFRIKNENNIDNQKLAWGLGAVLFSIVFTFISVTLFDQLVFIYYLLLSMLSSLNSISEIKEENNA